LGSLESAQRTIEHEAGKVPENGREAFVVREWLVPFPVDVRLTLSVHAHGRGDPAFRVDEAGAVWRTSLTPDGPATLRVAGRRQYGSDLSARDGARDGAHIRAEAWGPGADWILDSLPAQIGLYDDISSFADAIAAAAGATGAVPAATAGAAPAAGHAVVREIALRHPGLRIGRTSRVFEALVPAILEQKVVSLEAHRAWRILLTRFGTAAPGPAPTGMRVFPPAPAWKAIRSWDWHKAGVEAVRGRTIHAAATVAGRLERNPADGALQSIPGIGPWTSAETRQRALGDPDAVSVGDYNLPKAVGWALAGRPTTDDETMLELLEPYRGHRYRVTRMIELSGLRPPRRGPRMPVRDYRAF
jgi:3-methyladenine DNA glycosylase/8-oxoguanine DNA glycosylase